MSVPSDKSMDTLRRQAYLDEELPIEEVIELEKTLTPREREDMEAELRFEKALGECLLEDTNCSDDLWNRVRSQVVTASSARIQAVKPQPKPEPAAPRPMLTLLRFSWRPMAMVAGYVVAVLITLAVVRSSSQPKALAVVFTEDLEAFSMDATVPGDYAKVMRSLAASNLNVSLSRPIGDADAHPVELLGMKMHQQRDGGQMAELFFSCCGRPVAVFVTDRQHGAMLDNMEYMGLPKQWFELHKTTVDGYELKVIGPHDPQMVLGLFS